MIRKADIDVAWAAGLFEGEGCITANVTKAKGLTYRRPYLSLRSTDLDVVERFHGVVGCGRVLPIKSPSHVNKGRKPAWDWRAASSEDVQAVLTLLRPHLGDRRGEKADEALSFYTTYRKGQHTRPRRRAS